MKKFSVTFKLPQLAASRTWNSTEVEAPDMGLALRRAWQDLRKRPHIKGKRLKQATITLEEME